MAIIQALPEIRLVLDTDVFTYYRGQNPRIKQAIGEYISRLKDFPRLTAITVFETLHGFEKKQNQEPLTYAPPRIASRLRNSYELGAYYLSMKPRPL